MTIKVSIGSLWLSLLALSLASSSVGAITCATTDRGEDTVYFESSATLEFIEGESTDLSGWIKFDPANMNSPVEGEFRVDLRTLDTGIETRDEHMREDHLQTDKFPYAWFELNRLKGFPAKMPEKGEVGGQVAGYFIIHGVKRSLTAGLEISSEIDPDGGVIYSVRATFSIELDQYQIPRPKALFLKLAEIMEIELALKLHSQAKKQVFSIPTLSVSK